MKCDGKGCEKPQLGGVEASRFALLAWLGRLWPRWGVRSLQCLARSEGGSAYREIGNLSVLRGPRRLALAAGQCFGQLPLPGREPALGIPERSLNPPDHAAYMAALRSQPSLDRLPCRAVACQPARTIRSAWSNSRNRGCTCCRTPCFPLGYPGIVGASASSGGAPGVQALRSRPSTRLTSIGPWKTYILWCFSYVDVSPKKTTLVISLSSPWIEKLAGHHFAAPMY